jgi:hypothetical protein
MAGLRRLPESERAQALEVAAGSNAERAETLRRMLLTATSEGGVEELSERVELWARQRDARNADDWRGRRIGAFTVLDLLGQGGMGVVVSARRDSDNAEVALKLVRPDLISATLVRRLQREHDALARLDHPGIARLHGLHLDRDGAPFIEMEKVDGVALNAFLAKHDLQARISLLMAVAGIVGHAHQRGVVHRDLKPGNVLITADGQAKLLDFGIAKTIEEESLATMTATGERLLTPRYAAPEQLLGGEISSATDVFSLGVMLCELCMDQSRANVDTPGSHRTGTRTGNNTGNNQTSPLSGRVGAPGSRLPLPAEAGLRQVAIRALQPEPEQRYPDATALADDLARWLQGDSPQAARWRNRIGQYWRSAHLRRRVLIGLVAALILLGAAAGLHEYRLRQVIDPGYGFIERDLAGLSTEGKAQVRRALQVDAEGARDTAHGLVQNARKAASAHPLLTFLDLTWSGTLGAAAEPHLLAAGAELARRPNAYLQALLTAEARSNTGAAARRRMLQSALDLRPNAWRLRYALAHGEISSGRLDAALQQLQRIDIRNLKDRRAAQILVDRALLGDTEGARAALPGLPAEHPSWREWVMAAIEFGDGQYEAALVRFDRVSAAEAELDEPTIAAWGRMGRAICLGQMQRWPELGELAGREMRSARERGDTSTGIRSALLGAIASYQQADGERLRYFLEAARAISDDPLYRADVALVAVALGASPGDMPALIAGLPDEAQSLAGLAALLSAAAAIDSGNYADARVQLRRARLDGIDDTRMAEVARWFAAVLEPASEFRPPARTLWFAPWSNWVSAWVTPLNRSAVEPTSDPG